MSTTIDGSNSVTINSGAVLGITSGTAVASTSGTSIDFTSIPSWVKRITVMFNGVSTNGSSQVQVQIGSGSIVTTGYAGGASYGITTVSYSAVFLVHVNISSSTVAYGNIIIANVSGNSWVQSGTVGSTGSNTTCVGSGGLSLSGALDRIRITTVNGTDAFDAGSVNILYEG